MNCLHVSTLALLSLLLTTFSWGSVIARPLVENLNQPLYVATPPEESRWLFIVQKGGALRLFDRESGKLHAESILTIAPIRSNGERGFLGMAFHPKFGENGYIFVNYTDNAGDTVIGRYTLKPKFPYTLQPDSFQTVLTIPQDFANHNAGWLGFSPLDGFLYIPMGDGGSGNDPKNRAQDRTNLLGTVIRIDINGDDFPDDPTRNYRIPADNPFIGKEGRPEIWAYGLRNPWRPSFDRKTGDFWMADVGQNTREEINFQPAASKGGENYGWRLMEGTLRTRMDRDASTAGLTPPIYEYNTSDGKKSITGGYVYRGKKIPQLQGHYLFADYMAGFIHSFAYSGSGTVSRSEVTDRTEAFGNIQGIVSFGEDSEGEMFVVSLWGTVYEIVPAP